MDESSNQMLPPKYSNTNDKYQCGNKENLFTNGKVATTTNSTVVESNPPFNPLNQHHMDTTNETNDSHCLCENSCDLNNNSIVVPCRQSHTTNLFVNESTCLDLNGKSLNLNSNVSHLSNGSNNNNNNSSTNSSSIIHNNQVNSNDIFIDIRNDEIREDIEILVDIYLLFENATWLLSAFMW